MHLLELFSGTSSVGKVAKSLGYNVISLDLKNADINCDILSWDGGFATGSRGFCDWQSGILRLAVGDFATGSRGFCDWQSGILRLAVGDFATGSRGFCDWQSGILRLVVGDFATGSRGFCD